MSKVIVSHISDLDGRVSRELYVHLANIHVDTPTVWVEYGDLIEKAHSTVADWATGCDVTILDFSVSQKFLDDVAEVAESVLLFDHHTKTKELVAPKNCTIVCDTDESTVSLIQKYYVGKQTTFTTICRDIDLNLVEEVGALKYKLYFDRKFMQNTPNYEYSQRKLKQLLNLSPKLMPRFNYDAEVQLQTAKELANEAVIDRADRTATIHRDERHKGIDTDILAHFMLKNKKIDFALISWDKDNIARITSVRKLKENPRSLEEYCESRGGGGRATAGAFRKSYYDPEDYEEPCPHPSSGIDYNGDTRCSYCGYMLKSHAEEKQSDWEY